MSREDLLKEDNKKNDLKKEDLRIYCMYMTYKMVNFIETFHSCRITRMSMDWLRDDLD